MNDRLQLLPCRHREYTKNTLSNTLGPNNDPSWHAPFWFSQATELSTAVSISPITALHTGRGWLDRGRWSNTALRTEEVEGGGGWTRGTRPAAPHRHAHIVPADNVQAQRHLLHHFSVGASALPHALKAVLQDDIDDLVEAPQHALAETWRGRVGVRNTLG